MSNFDILQTITKEKIDEKISLTDLVKKVQELKDVVNELIKIIQTRNF